MIIRYFLEIITIMFVMYSIVGSLAYAQNATPAPVQPTPTNQPTPTTPTPNFQYLPQKAYVQPFKPEVGIPESAIPLTAVPQVVPAPAQSVQQTGSGFPTDIMGILAAAAAAAAYFKGHIVGKKTDKVEEVSKEQSAQIVKGAEVDESIAKQVFKNMPDGGAGITDAPEIKLQKLSENKEEAVDTATKA